MCPLEKIASCQISFTPMISKNYLSDIQKVIELITASGLEYDVGILSTTIRGNKDGIFMLLKDIYDTMAETCRCFFINYNKGFNVFAFESGYYQL